MEYISRFSKFLSKLCCNNTDCVKTQNGFQKCNDDSSEHHANDIELNKSLHIDNNITNEEDIFEPFEPSQLDESKDPINLDDFDEYHNHEVTDSDDEFTNVVIQQCE